MTNGKTAFTLLTSPRGSTFKLQLKKKTEKC